MVKRSFRPLALIAEVLSNLRANPVSFFFTVITALAVGFGIPMATLIEVSSIRLDEEREIRAGSNVLRITGDGRMQLPAGRCEELNKLSSVLSAGGLIAKSTVYPSARPNDVVVFISGTPSLGSVLWPGENHSTPTPLASVIAGSSAAETFGLVESSRFAFSPRAGTGPVIVSVERVVRASSRDAQLDASLFVAQAATGTIDECLVEAVQGAKDSVAHIVRVWFAKIGDVVVSPLYLSTSKSSTPEERLTTRITQWVPLLAGVCVAAGMCAGWFSRRAEYALYRLLGLRSKGGVLMLMSEMVAVVLAPVSVGMVFALVVMSSYGALEITLATGDALRALVLIIPTPLIGWVAMLPLTRADALHGR